LDSQLQQLQDWARREESNSRSNRWESCLLARSAQKCWIKTYFVSYISIFLVIRILKSIFVLGLKLCSKIGRKKGIAFRKKIGLTLYFQEEMTAWVDLQGSSRL